MSKQYEADWFIKTGGTSSQYLMADGTISTGPSGGVDVGTGTANKVAKFSDSDTITDGIMTDDGTSVLVGGNLAIGIGDNDNLFHIEATDNTYDVSRAMEIDYTKSHTTTGWNAGMWGIRTNIYHDGTGTTTDVQGGSFTAKHIGSGVSYYLLGSQSNAKHEGSGNTGVMWGAFNQAAISGTGTGTHPWLIGTNQTAHINNVNASVGKMNGILASAKTTGGDVTDKMNAGWLLIDGDQGSTTVVDANCLYLTATTSNITASGTIRAIHSDTTLPSLFLGTMETTSFIKTGGTSSQFLKADGSVDSNTYSTTDTQPLTTEEVQDIVGAMVQANVENLISVTYSDNDGKLNFDASAAEVTDFVSAANGGTFSGAITIDSDTDTILKLNNSDNGAQYVTYSRSNDRHAYVGFGGSSDNFTIMSEETGGQIILGTAATTRVVIDDDGYVSMRERVGIGGDFTPQKALHIKNAAPVFRFEDSDITGGYLDMVKSSRNMRFDLEQDDATAATNFNFRIGGTTHLYMKNNFVGVMNDSPSEALDVTGNVAATSFVKTGGTSSQFLKADGSVDSNTYAVGTIPTDFVSAASGGSFGGGIVADSFTITGLSSGDSFLKANGSLDGTTYNSGTGASGGVAIYNGTNTTTDSTRLQYNFLSNTLTAFDLNVDNDLQVAGDATVTGSVEADTYKGQVILLTANLSHTSTTTGYYNIPFNSLGESISAGEQHYFVSTGYYRLRTIIMKNTGTGGTPTITTNNFRVVKNGTTLWTGSSNLFGTGVGAYCSNGLTDTNAVWSFGDMIQFQFNPTGLWRDAAITIKLEVI